ncbi:MAG: dihydrodipicolinate synthase family protein, partial [Pseudomonadota bacterium]
MQFEGIYTPIVTPYFDDFTCNQEALAQTVDMLVEAGVAGIIVAGTTGEYYAQTMKERVWLMGRVKEMIAGRVPMIVGTGAMRTEDSVEYARQAKSHGADAILVATPPYAYPTGREI